MLWPILIACHGRDSADSEVVETSESADSDPGPDSADTDIESGDTATPPVPVGCSDRRGSAEVALVESTNDCWVGDRPTSGLGWSVRPNVLGVQVAAPSFDEDGRFSELYVGLPIGFGLPIATAALTITGDDQGQDFADATATSPDARFIVVGTPGWDLSGRMMVFDATQHPSGLEDAVIEVRAIAEPMYNLQFGTSVAVIDGDEPLIAVGAPDPEHDAAPVYLYGFTAGLRDIPDADAIIERDDPFAESRFGESLASGGDLDGDGVDDLLVGAPEYHWEGRTIGVIYAFCLPLVADQTADDACATWWGEGGDSNQFAGMRVNFVGDVDGDGFDDVLTGDENAEMYGPGTGRAYYLRGDHNIGTRSLADADATFTGELPWTTTGWNGTGDFDFDGDGQLDIAISAPGDLRNSIEPGRVYVFRGPLAGALEARDAVVLTGTPGDRAGHALAAIPDVDGDGRDELAIGAPYDSDNGRAAGKLYLVHGFWPE